LTLGKSLDAYAPSLGELLGGQNQADVFNTFGRLGKCYDALLRLLWQEGHTTKLTVSGDTIGSEPAIGV
jgi:hypothetical protein